MPRPRDMPPATVSISQTELRRIRDLPENEQAAARLQALASLFEQEREEEPRQDVAESLRGVSLDDVFGPAEEEEPAEKPVEEKPRAVWQKPTRRLIRRPK